MKEAALRLGLPVHQPERVRRPEVVAELAADAAEVMVVVGYGQIIPQAIIDLPPLGIINVHASLLPKYRGAAPIQWAIARGETAHRRHHDADRRRPRHRRHAAQGGDGDRPRAKMLLRLGARLAPIGADLLLETLERLAAGSLMPEKQDDSQATYAPILKKEDGEIDWTRPAVEIYNRSRGFLPWPGTYHALSRAPVAHLEGKT